MSLENVDDKIGTVSIPNKKSEGATSVERHDIIYCRINSEEAMEYAWMSGIVEPFTTMFIHIVSWVMKAVRKQLHAWHEHVWILGVGYCEKRRAIEEYSAKMRSKTTSLWLHVTSTVRIKYENS